MQYINKSFKINYNLKENVCVLIVKYLSVLTVNVYLRGRAVKRDLNIFSTLGAAQLREES